MACGGVAVWGKGGVEGGPADGGRESGWSGKRGKKGQNGAKRGNDPGLWANTVE